MTLPDDVALYIAAHINTNVRELEGALLHVAARASFAGQPLSVELARDALAKLIAGAPTGLTVETIQRDVAAYFDVKLHDLKGPKRHRAIAHPRMVAMYLARKLTNLASRRSVTASAARITRRSSAPFARSSGCAPRIPPSRAWWARSRATCGNRRLARATR